MVLFISNDLFFQPQVQQAAKSAGLELVTRANLNAGKQWLESVDATTTSLQAVIVDLKTVSEAADLVDFLSVANALAGEKMLARMAYGPHVKVDLLQSASDAGFQQVLTQGQFNRDVRILLQQIAS